MDGVGTRDHRWGTDGDPDGWQLSGVVEGQVRWWVDHRADLTTVRRVGPDGSVSEALASAELVVDDDGLPVSARVRTDGAELRAEVLAPTPVPLEDGTRRPRGLCRYRTETGAVGVGWIEVRAAQRARLGAASPEG